MVKSKQEIEFTNKNPQNRDYIILKELRKIASLLRKISKQLEKE